MHKIGSGLVGDCIRFVGEFSGQMYEVLYGKVGVEYEVLYGKVGVEYALGTTKHQVQLACSRRQRSSALLLTRLIPHTSCLHAQKYKAGPLSAMFIGLLVEERRGPPGLIEATPTL